MRAETRRALAPLALLAVVFAVCALATPHFAALELRDGRLFGPPIDVLVRGAPTVLAALGMTLVIASGGVDLSVGSVMAIAGTLAALGLRQGAAPTAVLIGLVLAAGAALGTCNGALVAFLGLQPIVATLVLLTAGRGIAQLLSGGTILTFHAPGFERLASGTIAGVPLPPLIALATLGVLLVATRKLAFGVELAALGDNPRAARLCGLPVRAILCTAYALSGLCAALAGLIVAADIQAADAASAGAYVELDAILAVVIGGTPLSGGRANLAGSFVGALVLQCVTTALLMHGLGQELALMIKAGAVLAVCAAQSPAWLGALRRPGSAA